MPGGKDTKFHCLWRIFHVPVKRHFQPVMIGDWLVKDFNLFNNSSALLLYPIGEAATSSRILRPPPICMMIKEAILSTMWMGYGEDGILRVRMVEDAVFDLEDAKLQFNTIRRLVGEKRVPVLLDARKPFTTTKDAHEYLAQQSGHRIATAVITTNMISKTIINTYITVFRPASPYKMFTDETEALEWLKAQMTKENSKK